MVFQTTRKFDTACVKLISGEVRVDRFSRPQHEKSVKCEFGFKVILKGLGRKYRLFQGFFIKFPRN